MADRILIYDLAYTGHHLKWVQLLTRAFTKRGRDVVVASTRESFASAEYAVLLKPWEDLFTKVVVNTSGAQGPLRPWLNSWRILTMAKRYGCKHVFLPSLDGYLRTLGILALLHLSARRLRFEGLLFAAGCSFDGAPQGLGDRVRRSVVKLVLARGLFERILFLDEATHGTYVRHSPGTRSRLVLCPDPVETGHTLSVAQFRARFGLGTEARVLGVFGMINANKGIDLLIEAFERYGPGAQEYLFFMGRHTPGVREHIRRSRAASHIVSVDRFVTDDELISGTHAVDVILSLCPWHMVSASMVIRAAAAGKPVLGGDVGWTGRTIRTYDLGMVCDPLQEASLLQGIEWAFHRPRFDPEKASAFARQNSTENVIELIGAGAD